MEQYQGLTSREAAKRLVEYGENRITSKKKIYPMRIFLSQFKDMMTMILLFSTVLSVVMGEVVEAITIIAIVFLNALLGFFQEFRTEKSLEKLSEMSAPIASVLREGKISNVATSEIVPGDCVLLRAGDRIPADCRIIENNSLMCDESILSGESVAVEKSIARESGGEISPSAMAYMGTVVTRGNGKGIVTKTGHSTEMGQIANMLDSIDQEATPLQIKLNQMGKYIALGCVGICAIVSITGILRGEPVFNMIITGISLSVAAIPEGLPAIVTIALALSVNRMVKRNAVIRKLHAVETLGCANIICSDKTGTLTENKMTVKELCTLDYKTEVTGSGYEKDGQLLYKGKTVNLSASQPLSMAIEIAVVCNNAVLNTGRSHTNKFEVYGEATEIALSIMGAKIGHTRGNSSYRVIKEIPFDSDRKMMSVVVQGKSGDMYLFTKGGSDILLNRSAYCATEKGVISITPSLRKKLMDSNDEMAKNALRVLGLCYRKITSSMDTVEDGFVFTALVGMQDPPRKEAFDAVIRCRKANIRPVMITGDNKVTACAIAKELKIYTPGDEVLTGKEIDRLQDDEFEEKIPNVSVFARVSPAHKLRIVRSYKKLGNVVAMTGDGVNDAPAVKEANIGVSMGMGGTDVTKEASSVILLDDNFATLVAAVEEGRVIYRNIRKFIRYLLSCNIGEVVTMFFAMLMGFPVPLLPIQILLINLVTDGLPAIALGLDPADSDVMSKKPRRVNDSIFSDGLLTVIIFRGFLIGLTTIAVFASFLKSTGSLEIARTGALVTLVLTQLIHVFECKSEEKSLFRIHIFNNWKLIAAVGISAFVLYLTIFHPVGRVIFRTVILTGEQLLVILGYLLVAPLLWSVLMHFHLGQGENEKKSDRQKEKRSQKMHILF